jgi:hypothetical protein
MRVLRILPAESSRNMSHWPKSGEQLIGVDSETTKTHRRGPFGRLPAISEKRPFVEEWIMG